MEREVGRVDPTFDEMVRALLVVRIVNKETGKYVDTTCNPQFLSGLLGIDLLPLIVYFKGSRD